MLGQAYQPTGEEAYKETPEQRVSDGAGQGGRGAGRAVRVQCSSPWSWHISMLHGCMK